MGIRAGRRGCGKMGRCQGRDRGRVRESQDFLLSTETHVGLDPGTPRSWPESKPRVEQTPDRLSHPGIPNLILFLTKKYFI